MPSSPSVLATIARAQQERALRIKLAGNLSTFPPELFGLAEHLEVLDLADNQLSSLPANFARFKELRILFLSNNQFQHVPKVLADCPKLEMIAFKNNNISELAEDVLPVDTRWLILTDNQITQLPQSMGKLYRLQKLALGGNQISCLPESMQHCRNLELARLSANQLSSLPDWLLQLPKLSWLAFAGNAMPRPATASPVPNISMADIQLAEQIGEGASGIIYKARWITRPSGVEDSSIAVKLFKGAITSDGYPQDELNCCLRAGEHPNLIKVLAQIDEDKQLGLVMELIPTSFSNLGLPPSLITCTRDTFSEGTAFSLLDITRISLNMANTMQHLHSNKVSHGDIYAHNTMINTQADVLFGDFGAASELSLLPEAQQLAMQKIEVRAFGCLMEDMLAICAEEKTLLKQQLTVLKDLCMQEDIEQRPSFTELQSSLSALLKSD